jgi:hypothetical protein
MALSKVSPQGISGYQKKAKSSKISKEELRSLPNKQFLLKEQEAHFLKKLCKNSGLDKNQTLSFTASV